MRAAKIMPRLTVKNKPYHERRRILNLPTLKFRRQRGDVTETYTILNGIYDRTLNCVKLRFAPVCLAFVCCEFRGQLRENRYAYAKQNVVHGLYSF